MPLLILVFISLAALSYFWSTLLLFIYISELESSTEFTQTKSTSDTYKHHTAYRNVASAVRCSLYCTQLSRCTGYTYDIATSTCSLIQDRCTNYTILADDRDMIVSYVKIPVIDSSLALGRRLQLF